MAVAFQQLQQLNSNDLFVKFTDSNGVPFDPHYIVYTFYGLSATRGEWVVGLANRTPTRNSEGYYFVNEEISTAMVPGEYYVEWVIQKTETTPLEIVGKKYFGVISPL